MATARTKELEAPQCQALERSTEGEFQDAWLCLVVVFSERGVMELSPGRHRTSVEVTITNALACRLIQKCRSSTADALFRGVRESRHLSLRARNWILSTVIGH
jgi:hypothetical protein